MNAKETAQIKGGSGGNGGGGGLDRRNTNPSSPIGNPGYRPDRDPTLTGTSIGPSYSDRARGNGGMGGGRSSGGGGSGGKRNLSGKGSTI